MDAQTSFFDELARIARLWEEEAAKAVENETALAKFLQIDVNTSQLPNVVGAVEPDAIKTIAGTSIKMAICTVLAAIDGITEMADRGPMLTLVDGDGNSIGDDLHYRFMGYLIKNGLYTTLPM